MRRKEDDGLTKSLVHSWLEGAPTVVEQVATDGTIVDGTCPGWVSSADEERTVVQRTPRPRMNAGVWPAPKKGKG